MARLPKDRRSVFDDLIATAEVAYDIRDALEERGIDTPAKLAYAGYSERDLDWIIWELLVSYEGLRDRTLDDDSYRTSLGAASLRRLWEDCWAITSEVNITSAGPRVNTQTGWEEPPPRRLDDETILELYRVAGINYPSEVFARDVIPGRRLLSAVYDMCLPGNHLKYIPWNKRLTEKEEEEDLLEKRGSRTPRYGQAFCEGLWDDPPILPEDQITGSANKVEKIPQCSQHRSRRGWEGSFGGFANQGQNIHGGVRIQAHAGTGPASTQRERSASR